MKMECQSVIESIREYIPLNDCLIDFDEDPFRFEHIFPGSITFVDTQSGNRNFVHSYMTQADISRMGSNCDLVPGVIQERKDHRPECYIHSKCTPRNDQLPVMGINDDNRQKIPQSNCSMRHTVMATSTLRCLTLFSVKPSELKL